MLKYYIGYDNHIGTTVNASSSVISNQLQKQISWIPRKKSICYTSSVTKQVR